MKTKNKIKDLIRWSVGALLTLLGLGFLLEADVVSFFITIIMASIIAPFTRVWLEKKLNIKLNKKTTIIVIIIGVFILGYVANTDDAQDVQIVNTEESSNQISEAKDKSNKDKEQATTTNSLSETEKQKLLKFYNDFIYIPKEADDAYAKWSDNITAENLVVSYMEIDNLIAINNATKNNIRDLDIPNINISNEHKEMLKDAKNDVSTAYYTRNEALKEMKKYLNNNDLEALSKAKQKNELYTSFIFSAFSNLVVVLTNNEVELP